MQTLLTDVHRSLSTLALSFTAAWAAIVLAAPSRPVRLGKLGRFVYFGALGTTGLTGVSGLFLLASAQRLAMGFPWVVLAAVAGHGVAGTRGRRALAAGRKRAATNAVMLQILFLVVAFGLMLAKPF